MSVLGDVSFGANLLVAHPQGVLMLAVAHLK